MREGCAAEVHSIGEGGFLAELSRKPFWEVLVYEILRTETADVAGGQHLSN